MPLLLHKINKTQGKFIKSLIAPETYKVAVKIKLIVLIVNYHPCSMKQTVSFLIQNHSQNHPVIPIYSHFHFFFFFDATHYIGPIVCELGFSHYVTVVIALLPCC